MVKQLNFNTLYNVLESWERVRSIENYELVAGIELFQSLFEKAPQTKKLFGFEESVDPLSPELHCSKQFQVQSGTIIHMFDSSLQLMGPDIELLTELLTELGHRHERYGVTPDLYEIMGDCFVNHVLPTLLKEQGGLHDFERDAWHELYAEITSDMKRTATTGGRV